MNWLTKLLRITFCFSAFLSVILMTLAFAITSRMLENILWFSMGTFALSGVASMASELWEEYTRLD